MIKTLLSHTDDLIVVSLTNLPSDTRIYELALIQCDGNINDKVESVVAEKVIKFEFEKQNKNSTRYKEVPEEGMPPVLGSIYVQQWFAGDNKNIEITIKTKD